MSSADDHGPAVLRDFFHMICGKKLGSGIARTVYENNFDKTGVVVKIEDVTQSFQNVIEWETWQRVKDTEFARWFAPCVGISPCGIVLVMARTMPATKFPDKLPVYLTDTKRTNYGIYKGRLVCHDYGTHLLMERGMTKRMRKANWWDLDS